MLTDIEKIQLSFACFCGFVGALYQFVNDKNKQDYSLPQRMVSLLAATLLMLMIEALELLVFKWNWIIVCLSCFLLGIGAEIFLRLLARYYSESTGLIDFIQRVRLAYKAAKETEELKKEHE